MASKSEQSPEPRKTPSPVAPIPGAPSDPPGYGRRKRPLTPAQLEAARVRAERSERRQKEIAVIRSVDPACEVDGDPPVAWKVPARLGADPTGVILELPRDSGSGMPGSRIVLARRFYDGTGTRGGEPRETVTAFTVFRDASGHLRRTPGVAFRVSELRAVAAVLLATADALDADAARQD
jgi:hypothetical protein